MITGWVIAPGQTASGDLTNGYGGFTIDAQTCDVARCYGFGVFFARLANMASVAAIFFCGLALTTFRSRKPLRWSTAAIVDGAGSGSLRYPSAPKAAKADLAVKRV